MAIEKNNSQFGFTGKTGKLVTRIVNGKRIVSARPGPYKRESKFVISNNNKFRYLVKLAKCITSIPVLKAIWKKYSNGASIGYRSIISENMDLATDAGLTESNIIIPSSEYKIINDISIDDNSANISFNLTQNFISTVLANKLNIILIFARLNEKGEMDCMADQYLLIPEKDIEVSPIKFALGVEVPNIINGYNDVIVFGTVTWNLNNTFELGWSSSFARKI